MTRRLGLIVTDASPLITLAAGEVLECLTMPGVTVIIPDMVYAEVTEDLARLGADDVVQWARRHHGQVEIVPTSVFAEFQALRAVNATRSITAHTASGNRSVTRRPPSAEAARVSSPPWSSASSRAMGRPNP